MDKEDATAAYTEATIAHGSARQLIDQLDRVMGAARMVQAEDLTPWRETVWHLEAARGFLVQAQAGEMLAQSA